MGCRSFTLRIGLYNLLSTNTMHMNHTLYLLCFSLVFFLPACDPLDEELVPMVGVYEGHLVGISGPFSMNIFLDGNDLFMEAPFEGFEYSVIEVDVNNKDQEIVDFEFCNQDIGFDLTACGDGIFSNGSLQLDYEIDNGSFVERLTLVASKL